MNTKLRRKFKTRTRFITTVTLLAMSLILSVVTALAAPQAQSTAVTVTVQDANGPDPAGVPVYVFSGTSYTNHNSTPDASGQVIVPSPAGNSTFRTDLTGAQ